MNLMFYKSAWFFLNINHELYQISMLKILTILGKNFNQVKFKDSRNIEKSIFYQKEIYFF